MQTTKNILVEDVMKDIRPFIDGAIQALQQEIDDLKAEANDALFDAVNTMDAVATQLHSLPQSVPLHQDVLLNLANQLRSSLLRAREAAIRITK